jgi:hypothetical protein
MANWRDAQFLIRVKGQLRPDLPRRGSPTCHGSRGRCEMQESRIGRRRGTTPSPVATVSRVGADRHTSPYNHGL